MPLKEIIKQRILENFAKTGQKYICPAWPHYRNWFFWDSCFHSLICTELGLKDLAKKEIRFAINHQRKDGWIPHAVFLRKYGIGRLVSERFFYPQPKFHSPYSQPPILAQAIEWLGDSQFTAEIFPQALKFYQYFLLKQDPDKDFLVNNFHPFETGNDSDPVFDKVYSRRRFKGIFSEILNFLIHSWTTIKLDFRYGLMGWDLEKIWQSNLFNIEYPLFVTLWVEGMRTLARLTDNREKQMEIQKIADEAETAIYEKMWDKKEKIFRSLDFKNQQIKSVSASHLVPILLDNIEKEMLEGVVSHLTSEKEFWTPYPIPSLPRNNSKFNLSGSRFFCNWSGPVWVNINWLIVKGLLKHVRDYPALGGIAKTIIKKTTEMVEREGLWEYYHPFSGKGMRIKNLTSFPGLVVTFDRCLQLNNLTNAPL